MQFNWLVRYFSQNALEILFSIALITLVYSIARILKARPGIALAFAFSPLIMAWSLQNAATRNLVFSFM